MRVLVCGSRYWNDYFSIYLRLAKLPKDTVIIEGEARGADSMARDAAYELGLEVIKFPADWEQYGKAAGVIRNRQMLVEGQPDLVLAFHSNITDSRGTKDMISRSEMAGIKVILFTS